VKPAETLSAVEHGAKAKRREEQARDNADDGPGVDLDAELMPARGDEEACDEDQHQRRGEGGDG